MKTECPPKKKCPMCGEEILAEAKKCKHCGEYLDESGNPSAPKSRALYILLAFLFGGLGAHNIYIGKSTTGMVQAVIGIVGSMAFFFGITSGSYNSIKITGIAVFLLAGLGLWILYEIISVNKDANGIAMK